MRLLVNQHGFNEKRVVDEFARALRSGTVRWISRTSGYTPEQYAQREWDDGMRREWLND